jgi:gliding motility-associated lipoprotein GldH
MSSSMRTLLSILLAQVVIFGCDSNRLFEAYHDFESPQWYVEDSVSFHIRGQTNTPFRNVLGIRYTDRYEYHNLFVKMVVRDSTDQVLKDTLLHINLFDPKTGKPLGKGYGNRFTKYDTLPGGIPELSKIKKIQFQQYMRKDYIEGIESLGLKLIQTTEY